MFCFEMLYPEPTGNIELEAIVNDHKRAFDIWPYGGVKETWVDDAGYTCIRYADGDWYHYGISAQSGEIVWW